ncbi:RDD family protein [Cellulosimicrobium protaetiae]|uniref:RDD family protein n=1 Tax=Cellulosimicrobium protaetiae TaxID=2587808 RepID=A0A6M5UA88_9MICO|nr:RDD family protein [Cellulosimicrobium protaetiae]QJW35034.1 RDD family protein [Cellulosimicrobium protaetiae]
MAIDAPTGRGPTHDVGAGELEPVLPGLGPEPTREDYASWSRRVVAYLLDTAIVATVLFLAVGPAYDVAWLPGISFGVTAETVVPGGTWWALGTTAVLVALQAWTGATPGKRTVGIVVVHAATERPAGLVRTVLRDLAHVLDLILYIGLLRPLWHPQRRTFADSICGTVVLRRVRPPVPFLGPGTGIGGPTPSRAVTGAATVLSVGSAVFVLGPATYTGGDAWTATCTPEVSVESPLTLGDVRVVLWSTPGTVSRWGVTRTAPAPDGAGDAPGLEASFPVDLDPGAVTDEPLDAALVLRFETWQGDDLGELTSPFRVEQHADGSSGWEVVDPTPDGAGLDQVYVPASAVAALPTAWHWEASVVVEDETVASCGGRGPS